MYKVNIISLGCSKNTVDSETLAGELVNNGCEVEFDSEKMDFDYVLINTCGFINAAKQESINTILSYIEYRKTSKKKFNIIVFGCLAQRYRMDLEEAIPEVDKLFGIMNKREIVSYIKQQAIISQNNTRELSTPKHYAYLKISEGCDRNCSFCAIPLIKGKHISRPIEDIVQEAKSLIQRGVKELILIAQDTSYYGLDLYKERKLLTLLEELCKTDVHWIRLQYSYPNQFPVEVLDLMNREKKICKYLDMPLQHINNRILESMNRNISSEEVTSLIEKIRNTVKDVALRTTLIVGYPSEKKSEFLELKDFVSKVKFDRMGAFTYSKEEGTKAGKMRDSIPQTEKQNRLDLLTEVQQEISFNLNQQKVGKVFEALIDRKEDGYFIGRTQYDSPEVDNEVLIEARSNPYIETGEFYNVRIYKAMEFDLYGDIVKK